MNILWPLRRVCSCNCDLCAAQFTIRELTLNTRVLWISNIILSNLTSISILIETVRTNRRCISLSLKCIHRADAKLFQWNWKGTPSGMKEQAYFCSWLWQQLWLLLCFFFKCSNIYVMHIMSQIPSRLLTGQWSCIVS
jgi:hypothetical protein